MTPPRSEDPTMRSNLALTNVQAGPSRPTPATIFSSESGVSYNPKLDSVSFLFFPSVSRWSLTVQVPIEKLQAMIIKNQEDKMILMEQKDAFGQGEDDWLDEDPEMIVQKMSVPSSRFTMGKSDSSAHCIRRD